MFTSTRKFVLIPTVKYYMFRPTMWPSPGILNSKGRYIKESNEFIKKYENKCKGVITVI